MTPISPISELKSEQNTFSVQLDSDQKFDTESPSGLIELGARAFANVAVKETKNEQAMLTKLSGPMTLQQISELQAMSKDLATKKMLLAEVAKVGKNTVQDLLKA